jgi:transposase
MVSCFFFYLLQGDFATGAIQTSVRHSISQGRRKIAANLPRERVTHNLPEGEKPCPCCGKMRCLTSKQVTEKLDWVAGED